MRKGSIFFTWWIICFILVLFSYGSSKQLSFYQLITQFSQLNLSNGWGTLVDDLRRLSSQLGNMVNDLWDSSGWVGSAPDSGWDILGWLQYIGKNVLGLFAFQLGVIYPVFQFLFTLFHFIFDILSDLITILVFVFDFLLGSA